MEELIRLWTKVLGDSPGTAQFEIWMALHTPEVVRVGILRTAAKDLSLGKTMSLDYKIRFASKVMLVQAARTAEHVSNRAKLCADSAVPE